MSQGIAQQSVISIDIKIVAFDIEGNEAIFKICAVGYRVIFSS